MLGWQNIRLDYIAPHIATITLNRPQQANALSISLLEELQAALGQVKEERKNSCCYYNRGRREGIFVPVQI
ncbi:hypothetical protein GCM10020331_063190 [Ectobacillus funiculus]